MNDLSQSLLVNRLQAWGANNVTLRHWRTQKMVRALKACGLADFPGMTWKDRKTWAGIVPASLPHAVPNPPLPGSLAGSCGKWRVCPPQASPSLHPSVCTIRRSTQWDPLREAGCGRASEEPWRSCCLFGESSLREKMGFALENNQGPGGVWRRGSSWLYAAHLRGALFTPSTDRMGPGVCTSALRAGTALLDMNALPRDRQPSARTGV